MSLAEPRIQHSRGHGIRFGPTLSRLPSRLRNSGRASVAESSGSDLMDSPSLGFASIASRIKMAMRPEHLRPGLLAGSREPAVLIRRCHAASQKLGGPYEQISGRRTGPGDVDRRSNRIIVSLQLKASF